MVLEPSCVAAEDSDQSNVVDVVLEHSYEGGVVHSNVGVVRVMGVAREVEVVSSEGRYRGMGVAQCHEVGVA